MTLGDDEARPVDHRIEEVLRRSMVDPDFRRRLLDDPHAAIRDAFGYEIPPNVRIRFVERDPDVDALIVLPDLRGRETREGGGAA